MSHFMKVGNTVRIFPQDAIDLRDGLPVGTYVVKYEKKSESYFLEMADQFESLPKYYGKTIAHADRILNTFFSRGRTMGVMLTGEKGSGKTLLAKEVSIRAAQRGISTLVINTNFHGDDFNQFIQSIGSTAVILFDEFEKVYDSSKQEHVLTLLDGTFPTNHLFVLTCNDKWRVDSHMRNRPGRIHYMIEFGGLSQEAVREYAVDRLVKQEYVEQLVKLSTLFAEFNFDMLKAIVEEMNLYGENPREAMELLNAKPEYERRGHYEQTYNIRLTVDDKEVPNSNIYPKTLSNNPLAMSSITVDVEDWDERDEFAVTFTHDDILAVDANVGKFVFRDEQGRTLVIEKPQQTKFDVFKLL